MACPKPPPLLCGLSGRGEMALAAGEFVDICESPINSTATAAPTKIVPPNPAFRSGFSSGFGTFMLPPKPYKSSASRRARADLEANFLRCSSVQKCGSFNLRKGLIFLRQYKQPIGLSLTMIQFTNQAARRICTKAKNTSGWENGGVGTRERALGALAERQDPRNSELVASRMLD